MHPLNDVQINCTPAELVMNMPDANLNEYSKCDVPMVQAFLGYLKNEVPALLGFDWDSVEQCEIHTEHYMWCTVKLVIGEFRLVIALNTIPFGVYLDVETYPLAPIDGGNRFSASGKRAAELCGRIRYDEAIKYEAKIRIMLEHLCGTTVRYIGTASAWNAQGLEDASFALKEDDEQAGGTQRHELPPS